MINEQTVRRTLPAFGHHEYDIPYTPAITELADKIDIKAEVKHADDAVADNNTATATFALTVPDLEPATALAVTETAASHNLAWTAPPATLIKTEGFETATAWATDNIGKWTMIDGDRGDCYGLLDDITYATTNLKVLSYNVYRDGELIGNTSSTTYVDNSATTGNHVYQVTTVYEGNLESAPVTHGAPTGIDTLPTAENAANAVVGIYTIDGKKVQTLAKGINIVKMKNGSARKIVK